MGLSTAWSLSRSGVKARDTGRKVTSGTVLGAERHLMGDPI